MDNGYTGEIRLFGGNFAPRNWAFCAGQLLPIAQYTALFSLLGTIYGGDGRTQFKLPDLRGRAATQFGTGPGLSTHQIGQPYGVENTNMNINMLPNHNHTGKVTYLGQADNDLGNTADPTNAYLAKAHNNTGELNIYDIDQDPDDRYNMGAENMTVTKNVNNTGSSNPINIMAPSLGLNFIICLNGLYPSRS